MKVLKNNKYFYGKTIFIPGGSKGIGKETAKMLVEFGSHVAIFARDEDSLGVAFSEMLDLKIHQKQNIAYFAADMTDEQAVRVAFQSAVKNMGEPDVLINCVGYAYPQYLSKLTAQDFQKNMKINYYGQLIPTLAVLPAMRQRQKGQLVFCSSLLGFLPMMGYTTYCPSKFALIGLAESMRHELKPEGIDISIVYPADTDTPGFAAENKTKPREVAIMSEKAGLYLPQVVAQKMLTGISRKKLHILFGMGKVYWRLMRFLPGLTRWVLDRDLKATRKKMNDKS